jgi:transcriptional regulator with GAF, ATPase, and Fis domain
VLRIDPGAVGLPVAQRAPVPAKENWAPVDPEDVVAAGDLNSVQRVHIHNTLRDANWVIEGRRGAAVRLGVKPATLRHRMKKLGITRTT